MDESDFIPPSLPANARGPRRDPKNVASRMGPSLGALAVPLGILAAALFLPIWFWFFWRIEPGIDIDRVRAVRQAFGRTESFAYGMVYVTYSH